MSVPTRTKGRNYVKLLGIALVILGVVAVIYGGIGYNKQTTILDVGGIKATATEHKTIPIAPIVGVIAVIGGVALLMSSKRGA
jgi:membrane-bound ClpP family serine protease